MNLSVGIVGLPNAGKSTLFNALLGRQIADVAEYPFTTIEPNVGVVEVPDERLERLAETLSARPAVYPARPRSSTFGKPSPRSRSGHPKECVCEACAGTSGSLSVKVKIVPAAIKFIDIAGLVKDAHQGAGLGNQFLAKIREVNAVLHVVRVFQNPNVAHPLGPIDPERDIKIINEELRQAGIVKPTFVYRNSEMPGGESLDRIIKECYKLLDLLTMFTVANDEMVQAWPVKRGTLIKEAVGIIHSDFRNKFIRAEVVDFEKLDEAGSMAAARSKGWIRVEGKNYPVQDGDVVTAKI
jgi:hypothetical protein